MENFDGLDFNVSITSDGENLKKPRRPKVRGMLRIPKVLTQ